MGVWAWLSHSCPPAWLALMTWAELPVPDNDYGCSETCVANSPNSATPECPAPMSERHYLLDTMVSAGNLNVLIAARGSVFTPDKFYSGFFFFFLRSFSLKKVLIHWSSKFLPCHIFSTFSRPKMTTSRAKKNYRIFIFQYLATVLQISEDPSFSSENSSRK